MYMNKDQGEMELLKYRLLFCGQKYKVMSKLFKDFIIPTFKIRISSTPQMKVPVPHLTPGVLPNPVRVPNLVVIMYNEIIVLFCALPFPKRKACFLYHY